MTLKRDPFFNSEKLELELDFYKGNSKTAT